MVSEADNRGIYLNEKKKIRGVSKAEWLQAAMEVLSQKGVDSLSVEGLARDLGISKSGFYWHFQNRQDLLVQLLDYWGHELTEVVTSNQQLLELEPRQRLVTTAEMIMKYDLTRYDSAFRQWAKRDPIALRAIKKVNQLRLAFTKKAMSELGYTGDDLEMRAMLFVCYHTWESFMFAEIPAKRRRKLIDRRIDLLLSEQPGDQIKTG